MEALGHGLETWRKNAAFWCKKIRLFYSKSLIPLYSLPSFSRPQLLFPLWRLSHLRSALDSGSPRPETPHPASPRLGVELQRLLDSPRAQHRLVTRLATTMFNLYRRIVSSDCASRLLSARSNSSLYALPSLWSSRTTIHTTSSKEYEKNDRVLKSFSFVQDMVEKDGLLGGGGFGSSSSKDEKMDIVHIKLIRNNTFVTITDSKGNKKAGASLGCLEEMKGGPKASRYAAEATAEHVGRLARTLGLKSVVMRVNGFVHFKKKKQAILAWREGFTHGRGDMNPIQYIEDCTRRPHNGCRLRKQRRI